MRGAVRPRPASAAAALGAAALLALAVLLAAAVLAAPARAQSAPPVRLGDPLNHALAQATGACDDLDPTLCLLPFPNDLFTTRADTPTGRRIDFQPLAMPRNAAGLPIDPTEWNRNDGFSPGSMALTFVPGLDLQQTFEIGPAHPAAPQGSPLARVHDVIQDPALTVAHRGRRALSPMVIVDAGSVVHPKAHFKPKLHPFWAELDEHPQTPADKRLLILRPTVDFKEGHRYIVALRHLRDAQGNVIPAGPAFRQLRDGDPGAAAPGSRQAHYDRDIFPVLAQAGVERHDLYLAWDFTVASEQNLAGRALAIRNDAFAQLGDHDLADGTIQGRAPAFSVTSVSTAADGTRTVRGTVTVPNYLDLPDEAQTPQVNDPTGKLTDLPPQAPPDERFYYGTPDPGPMAVPKQNPVDPTLAAKFVCTIPPSASAQDPATPTIYGHGLLGSQDESTGGSTARDREQNYAPCATDWIGMSEHDIANVAAILTNVSFFPSLADRCQQAFLNFLFLGRAMKDPSGFASDPAFQDSSGKPLIAAGKLVYDGNSQGGIMGGALTALAPDFTRAVLGVPGMNYSTLLNRSVDWEGQYADIMYAAYPDKQEQQLIFALMQMLWDRAEADGYAQHMTTHPLPDTPPHEVLMDSSFGDYQVADVAAEVEARTIGAALLRTSVPARHWAIDPAFGFPSTFGGPDDLTHHGSAFVYWDSGNPTPPDANVPPPDHGADPHEIPRRDPFAETQKDDFYRTGTVVDVHDGGPYCTYAYPIDPSVDVPACDKP